MTFVALAPIRDAELVAPTLADALGLAEQPGVAPEDVLAAHLSERELLLLLDNLEQLPAGAPLIGRLLARCPGMLTIAFTDSEGSTALTERLGDRRWLEVLQAHDRVVCREVERHRGRVVKSRGDGFMLAFRRPADGLGCAIAIQRAFARPQAAPGGIAVRIGLHTRPAIPHRGDYYGSAVNLAARIADRAAGGEILVSAAVRDALAPRPDCGFALSGELELKGLSGRHAAYAVSWAGEPVAAVVR